MESSSSTESKPFFWLIPRGCLQLEPRQGCNKATRSEVIGGAFIEAGSNGPKAFQAVDGAFDVVAFFIELGVVGNGHTAVFLPRNHGRSSGLLDVGPHVARVVGPVRQHGLAGAQVADKQARRLGTVPGRPAGQGQGANAALRVATQVQLGGETAPAAAKGLPTGAVFFLAPAATWCARTTVESTSNRCRPVAFCTCASTRGHTPACRQRRNRA